MTKRPITKEDLDEFRQAMAGIEPLTCDARIRQQANRAKTQNPTTRRHSLHQSEPGPASKPKLLFAPNTDYIDPIAPETQLFFARGGLQTRLLRQLRRGQLPVEAKIDLHGLTLDEAYEALNSMLENAIAKNRRHILIVHGKGNHSSGKKLTLKSAINSWLRQSDVILAFCSAIASDGGTGAIYVLLKKRPQHE